MKNWLKENWFRVGLLAVLVIYIASAFYWFEWRPRGIKIHCTYSAMDRTRDKDDYDFYYKKCLREKGL